MRCVAEIRTWIRRTAPTTLDMKEGSFVRIGMVRGLQMNEAMPPYDFEVAFAMFPKTIRCTALVM